MEVPTADDDESRLYFKVFPPPPFLIVTFAQYLCFCLSFFFPLLLSFSHICLLHTQIHINTWTRTNLIYRNLSFTHLPPCTMSKRQGVKDIHTHKHTHTHAYTHIYIYRYICIYVYMRICIYIYIYLPLECSMERRHGKKKTQTPSNAHK